MNTKQSLLAMSIALILSGQAHADTELKKTSVESEKTTKEKIITSADIDQQMNTSDSDVTRYISGVDMGNTGNRFGNNGFNIRGMEGDAVAITVDGISQGESLDPPNFSRYGMFSSTRNSIELESVKMVGIIKGASSITAGSGALGGAVMYTTKDAKDFLDESNDAFGGSVKIGYDGRNDERLTSVAVAKRFNDFEALAILTARESNETNAHDDGLDIVGAERGQSDPLNKSQQNVLVKLAYNISDDKKVGLVFEDYERDTDGKALSRESSTYSNFKFDDESTREHVGVFFDWKANTTLFDELTAKVDQQEIYSSGITIFDFTSGGSSYLRTEDRNYNQEMFNVSVDFTKLISNEIGMHDINYGIESSSTTVKNSLQDIRYNGLTTDTGLRDGYPIIDPSWVPETDSNTTSFYVRDALSITDNLIVSIGARYDKTSYDPKVDDTFTDLSGNAVLDADFSAVSSQLSVDYQVAPNHNIFASISTGFKAPTTQQLYLNTDSTSEFIDAVRTVDANNGAISYVPTGLTEIDLDTVTNPDLEAETALNLELSYTWSNDQASIQLTAFNSNYDNRIVNELQTSTFATPITQGTSSIFNPACSAEIIGDACYSVSTVAGDEWFKPVNSGEVTVRGFEIDAQWHINSQWDLNFSYSHAQGSYDKTVNDGAASGDPTKGDELESITPDNAVLGISYLAANDDWGFRATTRYVEEKEFDETFDATFYSDSAMIVDFTAFYKVTNDLTIRGGIYNAFDENYNQWQTVRYVREGTGGFFGGVEGDGIDRFSESGRELTVNISYSF